jgi:hypothetical protein
MSLFQKWEKQASADRNQNEYQDFWRNYLTAEQANYEKILESKNPELKGSTAELAVSFDMDTVTFTGFLDGINTSLDAEINLDELTDESVLDSTIGWEKLYFNMLDAKADWLYDIPAWDEILTIEKRAEIKKEYNVSKTVVNEDKIGRNDPCPCGSGKKYKKCCLNK